MQTMLELERRVMVARHSLWSQPMVRRLFLTFLTSANPEDAEDAEGRVARRGSLEGNLAALAGLAGLSYNQARTAMAKLRRAGEVSTRRRSRGATITLPNYDWWQAPTAAFYAALAGVPGTEMQTQMQTGCKRASTRKPRKTRAGALAAAIEGGDGNAKSAEGLQSHIIINREVETIPMNIDCEENKENNTPPIPPALAGEGEAKVEPQGVGDPMSARATLIRALLESQGSVVSERAAIEAAALPDEVTALWLEVERERRNGQSRVNAPLAVAKKRWEAGRGVAPAFLSSVSRFVSGLDEQFGPRPVAVVPGPETKPERELPGEPALPFNIAVLCGVPSAEWGEFHYDIARKTVRERKVWQGTLEELQAHTDRLRAEKQARLEAVAV